MSGKEVVNTEEAVSKVAAAVAARQDPDLVIIARTDPAAVHGLDVAIERARRYADAGADLLFGEAPRTVADIEAVAGAPFRASDPVQPGRAATASVRGVLGALRDESTTEAYDGRMDSFDDFLTTVGLPEIRAVEQSFQY